MKSLRWIQNEKQRNRNFRTLYPAFSFGNNLKIVWFFFSYCCTSQWFCFYDFHYNCRFGLQNDEMSAFRFDLLREFAAMLDENVLRPADVRPPYKHIKSPSVFFYNLCLFISYILFWTIFFVVIVRTEWHFTIFPILFFFCMNSS